MPLFIAIYSNVFFEVLLIFSRKESEDMAKKVGAGDVQWFERQIKELRESKVHTQIYTRKHTHTISHTHTRTHTHTHTMNIWRYSVV